MRADALAAATPTWATSSTRPETPASCSVTTLLRRGRVTLDGVAVAADDALEAGAGLLDVALELVARLGAATLVAGLELLELALGLLAGAERVGDRAGGARSRGHAPRAWRRRRRARRARRATCPAPPWCGRRGRWPWRPRASRCGPACGRGDRSSSTAWWPSSNGVVRRAAGLRLRAAGLRLAAAGFLAARLAGVVVEVVVVVLVVFSAMLALPPALKDRVRSLCSPDLFPANICT